MYSPESRQAAARPAPRYGRRPARLTQPPASVRRCVAAVIAASLPLLAGCSSAPPTRPGASSAAVAVVTGGAPALSAAWPFYGTRMQPPVAKPGFVFTDTAGAPFDVRARTAGRITVLFFGYTNCPDECPTTMANLAAALRGLPASLSAKVTVVFVTVDPRRDTGPAMRAWLDRFDPAFVGLSAPYAAVAAGAAALGIPVDPPSTDAAGKTAVAHGTESVVFETRGAARFFWTPDTTVTEIEHDIKLLSK
jgi:protein SCO1/2